jgi:hypothetical protein
MQENGQSPPLPRARSPTLGSMDMQYQLKTVERRGQRRGTQKNPDPTTPNRVNSRRPALRDWGSAGKILCALAKTPIRAQIVVANPENRELFGRPRRNGRLEAAEAVQGHEDGDARGGG